MLRLSCPLAAVLPLLLLLVTPDCQAQDAPLKVSAAAASLGRVAPRLLTAAQAECCPHWFAGYRPSFDRCCIKYGFCPICRGVSLQAGCWHRRAWHPIGTVIERNAQKCYEMRCIWARPQPTVHIRHISSGCGCCLYRNRVYRPGHILNLGVCKRQVCKSGRWFNIAALPGTNKPCPPGTITYNNSFCLFLWPIWVTWGVAYRYCSLLGGKLALPFNFKENNLILDELQGSAGWLARQKELRFDARRWGNETSPYAAGVLQRRAVPSGSCLGIRLGSRHWSTWSCGWHAQPVCLLPRVPCPRHYCLVNGRRYNNGATITHLGCQRVVCSNGYARLLVTPGCCYYQGWHPLRGWISGYWKFGSFSPFSGTRCFCRRDGTVTCCSGRFCLFSAKAEEFSLNQAQLAAAVEAGSPQLVEADTPQLAEAATVRSVRSG